MSPLPAPIVSDRFTASASYASSVRCVVTCLHPGTECCAKFLPSASQLPRGEPLPFGPALRHARVPGAGRCTVNTHPYRCISPARIPSSHAGCQQAARPRRSARRFRKLGLPGLQACWAPPGGTLTSAPMTPRLVRRRYSNGRVLLMVFRNGYRNIGMYAAPCTLPVSAAVRLDVDALSRVIVNTLQGPGN